MKLGLITDIHEHIDYLTTALDRFRREKVDRIVLIGDVLELGLRVDETCQLLTEAQVIGVWGNHDHGLCVNPGDDARDTFGETTVDFLSTLKPSLVIDDCYFAHVEPWLDPEVIGDLWYFEGPPSTDAQVERIFAARPHRLMFAGHYHSWMVVRPDGVCDWDGSTPIRLSDDRHFVVVGAVCEGQSAILNTDTAELIPFSDA